MRSGEVGLQLFFNGPEAFTPDGVYYMGEAPEVDNCYVAAGFNSVGIQSAGGVGWALADWIADKHPPMDLNSVDIRRAQPFQADEHTCRTGSPSLDAGVHRSRSGVDRGPFACRRCTIGSTLPSSVGRDCRLGAPQLVCRRWLSREYEYSYGKQNWHDNMVRECRGP